MSQGRRFLASFVFASASGAVLDSTMPVFADMHEGKVQSYYGDANASSSGSKALQGGINQTSPLEPSLKLIPGTGQDPRFLKGGVERPSFSTGAGVTQFKGNVCVPGADGGAPYVVPSATRSGTIPAISSYTLVPHTSVLQADPIFSVAPVSSSRGVSTYVPGYQTTTTKTTTTDAFTPGTLTTAVTPASYKGVTSYIPEIGVGSIEPARGEGNGPGGRWRDDFSTMSYRGVTTWIPGLEIVKQSITPPFAQAAVSTDRGVSTYVPGADMSISTSRSGVVCYSPGYEVSITSHSAVENKLGGLWTANEYRPEALRAVPKRLEAPPLLTVPTALTAQAFILPELRPSVVTTWKDWYQKVASAIYGGWQYQQVGPGVATLRVTIDRVGNLDSQVVDFAPAADVERNSESETVFREAALRACHLVNKFEIPEFPNRSSEVSVTFDVQLKRLVGTKPGIDVVTKPGVDVVTKN